MKDETTVTPVRYYVGDLCYVMHDEWSEVCDLTFPPGEDEEVTGELQLADGRKFVIFPTAYGDGVYNDQHGNPYAVDSGTIGAIKVDDIRDPQFQSTIEHGLGQIHEFPAEIDDLDCCCEDGAISIYNVYIDTAGSDCDEDEDGYEWDNEDEDA